MSARARTPRPTGPPRQRPSDAAPIRRGGWSEGAPPDTVAEHLRSLELLITRRLDGVLHGNYQGLTPGHGSEPGESRRYQAGDDVRRIDWNITARTNETHVREQIADHDLLAWLVVDASATMHFGTERNDKSQTAMAAAATVGFLTARAQNRLGAILVAGPTLHVVPPRAGKNQVRAILSSLATPPPSEGAGRADLAGALARVGAIAHRRGFVAVISDFAGTDWIKPLGRTGIEHELLTILVDDPRERDLPPIGLVQLADPATGTTREVRVTSKVQRRFAEAAAARRAERLAGLRRSRAEIVELSTADDWLAAIVHHVERQRVQAVHGGVMPR